jgi:hypothetical protein
MGKNKVQGIMASSVPPLIGFGSLVVVITTSLQEIVAIVVVYVKIYGKQ